jgi:hypothetical protein
MIGDDYYTDLMDRRGARRRTSPPLAEAGDEITKLNELRAELMNRTTRQVFERRQLHTEEIAAQMPYINLTIRRADGTDEEEEPEGEYPTTDAIN